MSPRRVSLVLSAVLPVLLVAGPAAAQESFDDVRGTTHEPAIVALASEGVVQGCEDGRFCPDGQLTRGQVATILRNALDLPEPIERMSDDGEPVSRFADTSDSVHAGAIEAIADAGLTSGCSEDRFCPHDEISRGELATLLQRALDLPDAADGTYFTDAGGTHGPAIESLADNGIAAGCSLVAFCANDTLARAHAATFIARALDLVERVELAPFDERQAEHEAQLAEQRRVAEEERRRAEEEARANSPAARAVEVAKAQVGKPYQWGGNGPNAFDCSGLTSYAWRQAGVEIPRTSRDQAAWTRSISRSQLEPGDLIFYRSPVTHVAMYIGDGKVVEAPNRGNNVRISSQALSRTDISGYGRVRY